MATHCFLKTKSILCAFRGGWGQWSGVNLTQFCFSLRSQDEAKKLRLVSVVFGMDGISRHVVVFRQRPTLDILDRLHAVRICIAQLR
jgi:hypothetical protein